jgi:hypothetical protein
MENKLVVKNCRSCLFLFHGEQYECSHPNVENAGSYQNTLDPLMLDTIPKKCPLKKGPLTIEVESESIPIEIDLTGKAIYPKIHVGYNKAGGIDIESYLRKQHTDGKWYAVYFQSFVATDERASSIQRHADLSRGIEDFHYSVYNMLICGIVIPLVYDDQYVSPKQGMHPLDKNQIDETTRLQNLNSFGGPVRREKT